MKTELILIRHGLTRWNAQKKYCGSTDIGINQKGKEQARRIKIALTGERIDKIYSSDRKRALQTARIIFGRSKIYKSPAFREMNFGVFEGLTYHRIMGLYPEIYKKWLRDPYYAAIPRAEHLRKVKKRVVKKIRNIVFANPDKTIALVCHGGVISVFMTYLMKSDNFWRYIPDSASLTFIEFSKGKAKVKIFNDTSHLPLWQKSENTWQEAPRKIRFAHHEALKELTDG